MKTTRIIIGCIFAAIAIAVTTLACVEWSALGCGFGSLINAIAFYNSLMAGLWYTIDSTIKEANQ